MQFLKDWEKHLSRLRGQNITSLLSKAYKVVDQVVLQELSEKDEWLPRTRINPVPVAT
jgi:hypothetical protein